jgi:hypothetical protein
MNILYLFVLSSLIVIHAYEFEMIYKTRDDFNAGLINATFFTLDVDQNMICDDDDISKCDRSCFESGFKLSFYSGNIARFHPAVFSESCDCLTLQWSYNEKEGLNSEKDILTGEVGNSKFRFDYAEKNSYLALQRTSKNSEALFTR